MLRDPTALTLGYVIVGWMGVIDVGHVDSLLLLLLQGIVGRHYLLSFGKGRSRVPLCQRNKMKGSSEAPFLQAFSEFIQLLSWLPLRQLQVISLRLEPS